ncbi:hypothetical protein [Dokdonia sp.]|uniref:hypothetical protein n=1 Tax=Dokdonia sp. TaxID=2024995 RepID=UPI003263D818
MKKQILKLGRILSNAEQKLVIGGGSLFGVGSGVEFCSTEGTFQVCQTNSDCCGSEICQASTIWLDNNGNYNVSGLGVSQGTQLRCVA